MGSGDVRWQLKTADTSFETTVFEVWRSLCQLTESSALSGIRMKNEAGSKNLKQSIFFKITEINTGILDALYCTNNYKWPILSKSFCIFKKSSFSYSNNVLFATFLGLNWSPGQLHSVLPTYSFLLQIGCHSSYIHRINVNPITWIRVFIAVLLFIMILQYCIVHPVFSFQENCSFQSV